MQSRLGSNKKGGKFDAWGGKGRPLHHWGGNLILGSGSEYNLRKGERRGGGVQKKTPDKEKTAIRRSYRPGVFV